jgi:DNA polymerase-3 subunit alpha
MAYFADYGFNKSHSAAYALITYQTGYLKAHHSVAFMAALMTCDKENTDKVVRFINEAKDMKIKVLPPDLNESDMDFSVVDDKIRFGLGAIKGVGEAAIEPILEARNAKGPFKSLFDFCERVDLKRVNRRVMEAMIKGGCFDSVWKDKGQTSIVQIGVSRARMFAALSTAIERGQKSQQDRSTGQSSLFGLFSALPASRPEESYPEVEEPWTDKDLLQYEKESLGFYVTGHPLDRYQQEVDAYASHNTSTLRKLRNRESLQIAGVISSMREKSLKTGKGRMAFLEFEDRHGQIEVLCFASAYAENEEVIKSNEPLLLTGSLAIEGEADSPVYRIRLESAMKLVEARLNKVRRVQIHAPAKALDGDKMQRLATELKKFPGTCATELHLRFDEPEARGLGILTLGSEWTVAPSDAMMIAVERIFGERVVRLR